MLKFKRIFFKNFLSTGNAGNEIQLDKVSSTIITGGNGNGKSQIEDSITFALFGKPFRNINKAGLINSINGKQCLVEIEFSVNGKDYKVVRGMKPNKFEIWCDGKLLNQDSATKDYQKILEQQILKLNYKTFTQVIILGSASYTPFMRLTAAQRREVIEDILDIRIFSVMNSILKDKITITKQKISQLENDIKLTKTKIESQKHLIQTISDAKKHNVKNIQNKIKENQESLGLTNQEIQTLTEEIKSLNSSLPNKSTINFKLTEYNKLSSKFKNKIEQCNTHKEFFNVNNVCPSCEQDIQESHRVKIISTLEEKTKEYEDNLKHLEECHEKITESFNKYEECFSLIQDKNLKLNTLNSNATFINNQIKSLEEELVQLKSDTSDVSIEKKKLKEMAERALSYVEEKTDLLEERNIQEIGSMLLKDNGIKTAIIREYLPVMNSIINKYLGLMDLYIKFELDESFNEVIKSRHRDAFSYESFSEGEKNKINTSIMLAWRQIAKMKNSVNTNLLILDEIMDSSLDSNAVELLMGVLSELGEDTNLFIISHRTENTMDKFDRRIEVTKINDFSVIRET